MDTNKLLFVIVLSLLSTVFLAGTIFAAPSGANFTVVRSETAAADAAQSHNALAGNVTELSVTGFSVTQSWQGYFGNVSGTIQLADASDNVLYNWSTVTAEGEVFAVNNSGVSWTNVECFNHTANGSNKHNATIVEGLYNIGTNDVDGIDETFALSNHLAFNVGTLSFSAGQCQNARLFNDAGLGVFDEVLLYENFTNLTVFTSILNDSTTGFAGDTYDFEMLVLEDGHSGDTTLTPYYFYVELNA